MSSIVSVCDILCQIVRCNQTPKHFKKPSSFIVFFAFQAHCIFMWVSL
jgi:hypothetical protein